MVKKTDSFRVNTKLDEKKILLVIIGKNSEEIEKAVDMICSLKLTFPQGHSVQMYGIVGSKNLAAAFNKVQKTYDAKYKIYLNASAGFVWKNMIAKAYESFFFVPNVGMVGLVGSELPIDGDYTKAENFYGTYSYADENGEIQKYAGKDVLYLQSVHVLDSNFFATNVDIEWDERVGDDFVMAAQCLRFRIKHYSVSVVWQEKPWIIFDRDNFSYNFKENETNYLEQLKNFSSLYKKHLAPLVSVLIPTYNQPKFCMEALESALNQTYPNIEILVGDDSTNEETRKAIKPYLKKHKNIKYFFHGKPLGGRGGQNMLFLLNRCSGEFINYLLPIYTKIPPYQLDEIICNELENSDATMKLTTFLFSRMNIFNIDLVKQQQMIQQLQSKVR